MHVSLAELGDDIPSERYGQHQDVVKACTAPGYQDDETRPQHELDLARSVCLGCGSGLTEEGGIQSRDCATS